MLAPHLTTPHITIKVNPTMLQRLADTLHRITNGKSLLIILALIFVISGLFAPIIIAFEAVSSGYMPMDTIFPLSKKTIFEQLPYYSAESRRLYSYFLAVDFVFPPALSLFFTMLWIQLAKYWPSKIAQEFLQSTWSLFPLISTALDWLENFLFIAIIYSLTNMTNEIADLACLVRWAKLFIISTYIIATPLIAIRFFILRKQNNVLA
jgi:hypothetical protein